MEGGEVALQQQGQPAAQPTTPKTLVELAEEGQKHLDTVVEAAHDILLSLNRALCSPSFWVAPSLQNQNHAAGGPDPPPDAAAGATAGAERESGSDKGSDSGEGLAALDATRVRYKAATGALRATVAAIVKQTAVKAENDGTAAENVDTMEADYLERRAADLREEVERKNQIVKLHVDQLRTLIADIFMWQTAGL
ncbi:hypothetical protein KC19_3G244500 [Ceratodon purpureus]|uniref:Mediator of RNA polymerase II transcription subunit 30 n=1 Tax=Ceratodon purpureus TaxID=3225 RepID=A0A8T0IME9_CERPU|nr:hypothetical protein KC19_3G244500 [Ceratodon purpureus]